MPSDLNASPDRPRGPNLPGSIEPPPPGPLPSTTDGDFTIPGPTPTATPDLSLKFTRAAALWSALIVGFLVLIVLLVFILQNTGTATIHFLGWEWNLPVGVAILFAAVCGGLLTVAVGTVRIYQLRRATKKALKAGH